MTTQVIKAIEVLTIIATVWSQIKCQLTPKMICGIKSLTSEDKEVRTLRMSQALV